MYTTLIEIRKHSPCHEGWTKLLGSLGKVRADNSPLHLRTILDSNGLEDALWCLRAVAGETRDMRLYGIWCARQVQNLMPDERSIAALDVATRHADGHALDKELDAAWAAAGAAAGAAAWAASDAAWAAWAAAGAAAWAAAGDAAWAAARAAARAAAGDASGDAAWAAAAGVQEKELRRVLDCIDAGQDPYPA
jgi:hypothetical protein